MIILTIESTCDETAAAVLDDQLQVLGSVVASQLALHERFGGVVPEIAARAHVESILPVIDEALRQAGLTLAELDAVAVATKPGLAGSLLVGLMAAKSLCLALDIPLVAVDHLQAHIFACQLDCDQDLFPCVGMVVSGGHTSLYNCQSPLEFELLVGTIDDAAGEAFDKVAKMLGLPFPGGPAVSAAAEQGDPGRFQFPRSFLNDPERLEFSFSGLKTAVRYQLAGQGQVDFEQLDISAEDVADISASFQEAVVDCLVGKAVLAIQKTGAERLCVGGGVAANRRFRLRLQEQAAEQGFELHIARPELCTDNAVMGAIAIERLKAGLTESLELDIQPGLVRG